MKRFQRIRQLQQRLAEMRGEGRKLSLSIDTLEAVPTEKQKETHEADLKTARDRVAALATEIPKVEEELTGEIQKAGYDSLFEEPKREALQGRETRDNNGRQSLETYGWSNLGEFAIAVAAACKPGGSGNIDARFRAAPANYHESAGSEGYLVPPAFRQSIYELVFNGADLVNTVDTEPTESNIVQYVADETTPWGSSGVQAYWRGEGQQMSATKLSNKLRTLQLHELYAFVLGTGELLEDATRLAGRLTTKAAQAIRWKASESILRGNGVGQPLGFFTSPALVTVDKENGQAADTINTTNIAKMFSRILLGAGDKPMWLANRDIVPQLVGLTIGNQPVWTQPMAGLRDAPGGTIMGIPIEFSEHSNTLGDAGDLALVNGMGYYSPQKRSGIAFASSIHLYFDYNIEAFRWTFRMGGQPYLSAPITPYKGSATKSHCIILAARD